MDRTVEGYLAELRKQLGGADPALVQDALYDAEEYLRSALGDAAGDHNQAFDAAVDAYGTPEEVAASYRNAELTVTAAMRSPNPAFRSQNPIAQFFSVVVDPRAWGSLFYLVLALATGIVYFTIAVTGLSLTAGLFVLIIGIPMALLFLAVVRAISFAEGRIVEGLLGTRMPRRPRIVAGSNGTIWDRIKGWLTDWRTWTTMLYMVLQLPLGIIYFTLMVTSATLATWLIAAPIWQFVTDTPVMQTPDYAYYVEPWAYPLMIVGGLLGYVITLWVAKGIGILHGTYAKTLLVGRIDSSEGPAVSAMPSGTVGGGL